MISWRKALTLLGDAGRRQLLITIATSALAAFSTALMIGSLVPFLTILSQPEASVTSSALSKLTDILGNGGSYTFLVWLAGISIVLLITSGLLRILNVYTISRFTADQKR